MPSDLGTVKVANPAEVTVEMMPGQTVNVGSRVSFRITSKKPGYLVLVDVDATGHLTQIYPNTASLIRANNPNGQLRQTRQQADDTARCRSLCRRS